jgi:hypothetical protein
MSSVTTGWENFFVAEVGAAAALSGLLFVAVSINLTRILAIPYLPERAGETLLLLLGVLAIATLGLVPDQTARALGAEVLAVGALMWTWTVRLQLHASRDAEARRWLTARVVGTQLSTLPFIVGGASLTTGHTSGLYWTVPGVLASFGASILNAWVLLVEILR